MRPSAIRSLMRDHRASLAAALTLGTGVALMARRALRSTAAAPLSWPPSPPPHPIEGAIFDLDGTLVGSEYLAPLAWGAVLREAGVDNVDHEELERALASPSMRGASADKIAKHCIEAYGIDSEAHPPSWMVKRKRALAVELVVGGPSLGPSSLDLGTLWFEGTTESVKQLTKVLGPEAVALCTSNLGAIVRAQLATCGMDANVFGGGLTMQEDVLQDGAPQLKPNPAPYTRALGMLGRPAGSTVAVEDSVVGVRSAVAAGVGVVLGVLNRGDDEQARRDGAQATGELLAAGAYGVFGTTREAIDWIIEHASSRVASVAGAPVVRPAGPLEEADAKEAVVRRYFEGVNKQDHAQISSCFTATVELRDMCGPSRGKLRSASASDMGDRCMDFVAAHPDCIVRLETEPRLDRDGKWVWCHWAETGTWSGESCGLKPDGSVLEVSGHTRFEVEKQKGGEYKIARQVVYRTFANWELSLR